MRIIIEFGLLPDSTVAKTDHRDNDTIITVDTTKLASNQQVAYAIAHELGHYFNAEPLLTFVPAYGVEDVKGYLVPDHDPLPDLTAARHHADKLDVAKWMQWADEHDRSTSAEKKAASSVFAAPRSLNQIMPSGTTTVRDRLTGKRVVVHATPEQQAEEDRLNEHATNDQFVQTNLHTREVEVEIEPVVHTVNLPPHGQLFAYGWPLAHSYSDWVEVILGMVDDHEASFTWSAEGCVLSWGCREIESEAEARNHWVRVSTVPLTKVVSKASGEERPHAIMLIDWCAQLCKANGWKW